MRWPPLAPRGRLRAFTLVELLVAVAIVGVVAALALPVFRGALVRAKQSQCAANLRAIGVAVAGFSGDNNGLFPRGGWGDSGGVWDPPVTPGPTVGWLVDIWPYVGKDRKIFMCPAASELSPTGQTSWTWMPGAGAADPRYPMHYAYNAQLNTNRQSFRAAGYAVDRAAAVQRFSGLPVMAEVVFQNNFYGGVANFFDPAASQTTGTSFAVRHGGRGNVLWGDGSVGAYTLEEWARMPAERVATGSVFEKRYRFCKGDY